MRQNETIIRVRYIATDQMGVVHHANYFAWFEIGREEYFRELGMSYKYLEQNGIFMPIVEAYCKFKSPARYDDQLRIITRLNLLQEVKLGFQYDIIEVEKNTPIAYGHTIQGLVDKNGKPLVLRKQNPFLWKFLQENVFEKKD
ncbi:MAG: acyl-CoA thioesterase [Firmicutes bacterium]|nr:acyl-CoA thioesterase [Bacillota bacterium]